MRTSGAPTSARSDAPGEPHPIGLDGSAGRRRAWFVAFLALAFVGLAFLKPWAGAPVGSFAPTSSGNLARATSDGHGIDGSPAVDRRSPAASPEASLAPDPNAILCLGPDGVELLTLVRWPGHEVRTWQPTSGAFGDRLLAPGLAPAVVYSSWVLGIGVCTIGGSSDHPSVSAGALVDVVALDAGHPTGVDLGAPTLINRISPDSSLGVLYGPPAAMPGGSASGAEAVGATWAPGEYGLAFLFPEAPSQRVTWVRVRILAVSGEPEHAVAER